MIAAPNGRVNLTSRLASPRNLASLSCRLKAECRTTVHLVLCHRLYYGDIPPPRLIRRGIFQSPIRPSIGIPILHLAAATLLTPMLSRPRSSTANSNIVSTPKWYRSHMVHHLQSAHEPRKYHLVLPNPMIKVTASAAKVSRYEIQHAPNDLPDLASFIAITSRATLPGP